MARYLALDWDHNQLHVVSATVSGGAVRVQHAAVFDEELSPNLPQAEELGKLLRDRLKAAGISPAPVLACIGRDRVVVKDIRFPKVPAAEEPAIVRFQAVKELSESPEEVVIDYTPTGEATASGEQKAHVVALRRELLAAYQGICKSAGLKLVGLTPRPFGTLTCLRRLAGTSVLTPPADPGDAVAVLTVSERWAEFCVTRNGTLLLARSLAAGGNLAGEVKRNLVLYAGQAPGAPVKALYFCGTNEHAALRDKLQDSLGIPIHPLDPFAGSEKADLPASHRGSFAGAVGLLHAKAEKRGLPINFVEPREPKPPSDPNKKFMVVGGAVAALVLVGTVIFCTMSLVRKNREIVKLTAEKTLVTATADQLETEATRMKSLADWLDSEVVWLDELYDLTDRFPEPTTIRLTKFNGEALTHTAKDKHIARLKLEGLLTDDRGPVDELTNHLARESYYRGGVASVKTNTSGQDRRIFRQQFSTSVDMERLPPSKYVHRLPAELSEEAAKARERRRGPDMGAGDMGFGFGQ